MISNIKDTTKERWRQDGRETGGEAEEENIIRFIELCL